MEGTLTVKIIQDLALWRSQQNVNSAYSQLSIIRYLDYPPLSLSAIKTIGTGFIRLIRLSATLDYPPPLIIRQHLSGADGGG